MHVPRIYTFDHFTLDTENCVLFCGNQLVRLAPKVFETLQYLVEHPDQIITQQELIQAVWRGSIVEKGGIARNISALRTALDISDNNRYIVTVAKRGYKFCAAVSSRPSEISSIPSVANNSSGFVVKETNENSMPRQRLQRFLSREYSILIGLFAVALATAFVIPTKFNWSEYQRRQLTSNSPDLPIIDAAISPDGKTLAYTELNKLYISQVGSAERRALPVPPGALPGNIEWFPDNAHLMISGFNPQQHRPLIWSMSLTGTTFNIVDVNAATVRLSANGKYIAYVRNLTQLWIADSDGHHARQLATTTALSHFALRPQFSIDSKYIIVARVHLDMERTVIEARHIISGATIPLYETDHYIADFHLLPSNDLFISETTQHGSNIISIAIDLQRGTHGSVHAISSWPVGVISHFSATQDGKRVTAINDQSQSDVYIAALTANNNAINRIHRLTMNDSSDRPAGWWDDHSVLFYSNRHNNFGVYRQSIDQVNADLLINDRFDNTWPVLTPDHRWLLYFASAPGDYAINSQISLMRKPMGGGPAELIDTKPDLYRSIRCASTANFCVLAEHTANQTIYYKFDPEKGSTHELARVPWMAGYDFYDWDVSPDASHIAYIDTANNCNNLGIITLGDTPTITHITVPGFEQLSTLSWDAQGKGFFISSHEADSDFAPLVLLHMTLDGHVSLLRYQMDSSEGWAIPSPDGQQLAFQQWSPDGNVWLLERN